jgi:hypothetical protein
MKTLEIHRAEKSRNDSVDCATGGAPVYRQCASCSHCKGVVVGGRVIPAPQARAWTDIMNHAVPDEALMSAAMQYNTLVRDGSAITCDDEAGEGYRPLYR